MHDCITQHWLYIRKRQAGLAKKKKKIWGGFLKTS